MSFEYLKLSPEEWAIKCNSVDAYSDLAPSMLSAAVVREDRLHKQIAALAAQAAAPVDLPPLPKPHDRGMYEDIKGDMPAKLYGPDEMRAYARAALAHPVAVDAPSDPIDQFLADNLKLWKDEGVPAPANEVQSIQAWLRCLGHHGKEETANRMRARMLLLMNAANTLHEAGPAAEDAAGIYDNRSRAAIAAQDKEGGT